jgi:hypothetical protein
MDSILQHSLAPSFEGSASDQLASNWSQLAEVAPFKVRPATQWDAGLQSQPEEYSENGLQSLPYKRWYGVLYNVV